nr:hypothetical protein [Klebsiella pneumoniae]
MIGYTTVGTTDMEKAKSFYTPLLAEMGAKIWTGARPTQSAI